MGIQYIGNIDLSFNPVNLYSPPKTQFQFDLANLKSTCPEMIRYANGISDLASLFRPSTPLLKCLSKRFSSTGTLWIEIWSFPYSDSPISKPLAKTIVVERCSMKNTSIIPNSNIILILPPEPYLQIVIVQHKPHKPIQQILALLGSDTIYMLDMASNRENRFPTGDRVGSHDWMHGFEF